jgi:hypothetical protein
MRCMICARKLKAGEEKRIVLESTKLPDFTVVQCKDYDACALEWHGQPGTHVYYFTNPHLVMTELDFKDRVLTGRSSLEGLDVASLARLTITHKNQAEADEYAQKRGP